MIIDKKFYELIHNLHFAKHDYNYTCAIINQKVKPCELVPHQLSLDRYNARKNVELITNEIINIILDSLRPTTKRNEIE